MAEYDYEPMGEVPIPRRGPVEVDDRNLAQKGVDWFTGARRIEYPNQPEIGEAEGLPWYKDLAIGAGLLMAPDADDQQRIIKKQVPGAQFSFDRYGNPQVYIPQAKKRYYLNTPGPSAQDFTQGAAEVLKYTPAGKMAAGAGSLGGKVLTGALASGATSLAEDFAAMPLGGGPVDLPKAITTAIGGGAGEAGQHALGIVWRHLKSMGGVTTRGGLTAEGRQFLIDEGFDPDNMGAELQRRFQEQINRGLTPDQSIVTATADSLNPPVPITRGEASGMPGDQLAEDAMLKGDMGQNAAYMMKGRQEAKQQALRANLDRLETEMGPPGAVPMGEYGQAGHQVQPALQARSSASNTAVGNAYDAAREAGGGMPAQYGDEFAFGVENAAGEYLTHSPKAQERAAALRELLREGGDTRLTSLESWRRTVTNLANNTIDPTEGTALRQMREEYDRRITDMARADLMSGDPEAVGLWREAISARKRHGGTFEGGDLVSDILEREYKGGQLRLKYPPEAVSNLIFGLEASNLINKPQLVRDLRKVRRLLGEESEAWASVRQESFLRLMRRSQGMNVGGDYAFSGANIKRDWDRFRQKNPEMARLLFSDDQRRAVTEFANFAARVTNTARNYSNTASTANRIIQHVTKAFGFGADSSAVLYGIIPPLSNAVGTARATMAAGGRPRVFVPPGPMGASAGTTLGAAGAHRYESTGPTGVELPPGAESARATTMDVDY